MEDANKILDNIPERPGPSKLAPFESVIYSLRRKRRTYREIAAILASEFHLTVSKTAVHEYVRVRARGLRKQYELPTPGAQAPAAITLPGVVDVRARIEAFKLRKQPEASPSRRFEYTEGEPLILMPETDKEDQ
jgi:hypothetical protein